MVDVSTGLIALASGLAIGLIAIAAAIAEKEIGVRHGVPDRPQYLVHDQIHALFPAGPVARATMVIVNVEDGPLTDIRAIRSLAGLSSSRNSRIDCGSRISDRRSPLVPSILS